LAEFPEELVAYGLNEELLATLFRQVQSEEKHLSWCLKAVPNNDFYQTLHPFLKNGMSQVESQKQALENFTCQ